MLKGSVLGHDHSLSRPPLGQWSIVAQKVTWSPGPHLQKEHLGLIGPPSWELDSSLSLLPSSVPFPLCTRASF